MSIYGTAFFAGIGLASLFSLDWLGGRPRCRPISLANVWFLLVLCTVQHVSLFVVWFLTFLRVGWAGGEAQRRVRANLRARAQEAARGGAGLLRSGQPAPCP